MTQFCISVDVEEDFPGIVRHGTLGIEEGLPRLIGLLADSGLPADFFFLSTVVKAYPDVVRQVALHGFGIGNHGLDHRYLCAKSPERQRDEIAESTRLLAGVLGFQPRIFRAPNFSVDNVTLALLERSGYAIDSSVLPGRVLRRSRVFRVYNHRGAPLDPHVVASGEGSISRRGIVEVPVTPNPLRPGAPLGLGALNFYGVESVLKGVKGANLKTIVFLIHPWEALDVAAVYPDLPVGYTRSSSQNLRRLEDFLTALQPEVEFTGLESVAVSSS